MSVPSRRCGGGMAQVKLIKTKRQKMMKKAEEGGLKLKNQLVLS